MKKDLLKAFILLTLGTGTVSCGDDFLDTDYYSGIDAETGLSTVSNVETALNGTYYRLFYYCFAGNYAINIGDISTDIAYWNGGTSHFNTIYQYTFTETDSYLYYIWSYGYKVVDNSARVIQGAQALYDDCTDSEQTELDLYMAEAYALRGYAMMMLINVYGHQVMVDGTNYTSQPGVVIVDEPIEAYSEVSRSTVGECYDSILSDFSNAISHFEAAGGDRGNLVYIGKAATYGLLARANLYLENWSSAITYAQKALDEAGISTLTYGNSNYKNLYYNGTSNTESMFALAITSSYNWSANSCGTLWSTYDYSPSPKLLSLYGENDCRTSIFEWDENYPASSTTPEFEGGKFSHYESGNSAYGTNYIVNAPEMYLIMAEANLQNGSLSAAKTALLTVAKRDADITSVDDLPSSSDDVMEFIKDERARELFQEGFRLWDLRRWDEAAEVDAYNAPNITFTYTNYKISNLLFPIPDDEITAGFGVEQNDWSSTTPK